MQLLENFPWPGNVRELANIVERVAIIHRGMDVTAADIRGLLNAPQAPANRASIPEVSDGAIGGALADKLDDYERRLILGVLAASDGNVAEAARRLSTDRPNLYRRMKRLGIDSDAERAQPAHQ